MTDFSIKLNAQVHDFHDRYIVLDRFHKVAADLPVNVDASVSVFRLPDNAPSERYEELCYDETTLIRVSETLKKTVTASEADTIINNLLNAGILFRERPGTGMRVEPVEKKALPAGDVYLPDGVTRRPK